MKIRSALALNRLIETSFFFPFRPLCYHGTNMPETSRILWTRSVCFRGVQLLGGSSVDKSLCTVGSTPLNTPFITKTFKRLFQNKVRFQTSPLFFPHTSSPLFTLCVFYCPTFILYHRFILFVPFLIALLFLFCIISTLFYIRWVSIKARSRMKQQQRHHQRADHL